MCPPADPFGFAAMVLMNSPSWAAATASTPCRPWLKPMSRHLQLAVCVGNEAIRCIVDTTSIEDQVSQQCQALQHPLHCAASQGLIQAGIELVAISPRDVNVKDDAGRTPLHWAAMTNHVDFARMLLVAGAARDARDNQGITPLISAAAFGAARAVSCLLEFGADKNDADNRGLTPLHAAASSGHIEVAQMLLEAGADKMRRASIGATPRNAAERQGHRDMVRLLANVSGANGNNSSRRLFAEASSPHQNALLRQMIIAGRDSQLAM